MEGKLFTFAMNFEFIADSEQEALDQFQEMLDDNDWENGVLEAKNWKVEVEDVEVSDVIIADVNSLGDTRR